MFKVGRAKSARGFSHLLPFIGVCWSFGCLPFGEKKKNVQNQKNSLHFLSERKFVSCWLSFSSSPVFLVIPATVTVEDWSLKTAINFSFSRNQRTKGGREDRRKIQLARLPIGRLLYIHIKKECQKVEANGKYLKFSDV
jgi:hypothetical protein